MKKLGEFTGNLPAKREEHKNEIQLSQDEIKNAVSWLEGKTSTQVEKNIEKRLLSVLEGNLEMRVETRFTEDDDSYQSIVSINRPIGITEEKISNALRILTLLSQPGSSTAITAALQELSVKTLHQSGKDRDEKELQLRVYRNELQKFPADVALEAINFPWKWFPALADLTKKASDLSIKRRSMLKIIGTWKPWDENDQIELLKSELKDCEFDIRYYFYTDPEKSKKAEARFNALTGELKSLGYDVSEKLSDEELNVSVEDFNAKFPKDKVKEKKKTYTLHGRDDLDTSKREEMLKNFKEKLKAGKNG